MRVLVVDRYFWPDTASHATLLKSITEWLASDGHEVSVLAAQPSYKPELGPKTAPWRETSKGVMIRRLSLLPERKRNFIRYFNHLLFAVRAFVHVLASRRYDVVFTQSTPPVVQAFLLSVAARMRGMRCVYHVHDIYPELARSAGLITNGPVYRLAQWLDNRAIANSTVTVPLSGDMIATLRKRAPKNARFERINNFSSQPCRQPAQTSGRTGPVRFVFAGNLGRVQALDKLVDAFALISPDVAILEFLGEGARRGELERKAGKLGMTNVTFHGHLDPEAAFDRIAKADVGVISLMPQIIRFAYPSKLATYAAANIRILAIVEEDSELAGLIARSNAGRVIAPGCQARDLARTISQMAAEIDTLDHPVPSISAMFSTENARKQWLELFRGL